MKVFLTILNCEWHFSSTINVAHFSESYLSMLFDVLLPSTFIVAIETAMVDSGTALSIQLIPTQTRSIAASCFTFSEGPPQLSMLGLIAHYMNTKLIQYQFVISMTKCTYRLFLMENSLYNCHSVTNVTNRQRPWMYDFDNSSQPFPSFSIPLPIFSVLNFFAYPLTSTAFLHFQQGSQELSLLSNH